MLASFLESKPEFQTHTKEYFKHNPINDKPLEEMRQLKVNLNKEAKKQDATDAVKEQARQSIRTYSHMLKVHKEKKEASYPKPTSYSPYLHQYSSPYTKLMVKSFVLKYMRAVSQKLIRYQSEK